MLLNTLKNIFGTKNEREVKKYLKKSNANRICSRVFIKFGDRKLKAKFARL